MTDNNSNYQPATDITNRTNDTNGTNSTNGTNDVLTPQNLGFDPHALANEMIANNWFGRVSSCDPQYPWSVQKGPAMRHETHPRDGAHAMVNDR